MAKKIQGVELPSTLERSPAKAQRTFAKAMANAEKEYGSGERAGRTAYGALKNGFEKVGDHWEPKHQSGPSDPRAKRPQTSRRRGEGKTYGGVDVEHHTKDELYRRAKDMGLDVTTSMRKGEIAEVLQRRQG